MQMRWKAALLCGWVFLFVAAIGLSATAQQSSQNNTVFRIGTFDRSSAEFAQEQSESAVKFVVNQSNSAKDWPATQPAEVLSPTGNPEAGRAAPPRVISFSLDHAPAAAYQLHISFLIE